MWYEIEYAHNVSGSYDEKCVLIVARKNKFFDEEKTYYHYNIENYDNKLYRVMDAIDKQHPDLTYKQFSTITEFFRPFCVLTNKGE